MSQGINWFKDFKIKKEIKEEIFGESVIYVIEFLDGDETCFNEENIVKYQEAFKKYGGITIPYVNYEYCSKPKDLEFIEPKILSEVCSKILSDCILDKDGIKDRIEWFKKMSDKGYYFSFDNEIVIVE